MNLRKIRGLQMAHENPPKRVGRNHWRVTSHEKPHRINMAVEQPTCSCPDFDLTGKTCKHIFAVEFMGKKSLPRTSINRGMNKPTYPQDWPNYNAAQMNEKTHFTQLLKDLCMGIEEPEQNMGRPKMPLKEILFGMGLKTYGTLSGRRSTCDLRDCKEKALIEKGAHYNTIFKYAKDPALTEILKTMIIQTSLPLKEIETDFAMDASGFATSTYSRWDEEKWGGRGKREKVNHWLKLNINCGVKTNIITAVTVTGKRVHDTKSFQELFEVTAENFTIKEQTADKAYNSDDNFETVVSYGATPYIPFKKNATGKKSELFGKLFHLFQYKKDDFLAHYHKRSNAETTMSMLKTKFKEGIRAKNPIAQTNELLCKVLCHNLVVLIGAMYELGVEVEFWGQKAA